MARQRTVTEWIEKGSGTDATATATRAASSGDLHFVAVVTASLTGSGNTADLSVSDGTTTLFTVTIHDDLEMELPYPIKLSAGNKAEASLTAGGSEVDGHVMIGGFTRAAD